MPEASVYDKPADPVEAEPVAAVASKPKRSRSASRSSAPAAPRAPQQATRRSGASGPDNPPPVGATVAYRLRLYGEWVEATVIDSLPPATKKDEPLELEEPDDGCLNLSIKLNPRRHFSSKAIGYRMNVKHGTGIGHWLAEIPWDNDERVAAAKQREATIREARLQAMRGDHIATEDDAIS